MYNNIEGKRKMDVLDEESSVKRPRLESASTIPDTESTSEQHIKGCPSFPRELSIGSCVYAPNIKLYGAVGPILKITETGELCFLTARHIFGPFRFPKMFIGTDVYLKASADDNHEGIRCGQVIAAEYGESLDVALVKISEECRPSRVQFIRGVYEHLTQDWVFSPHYQGRVVIDARELIQEDIASHRLIKFGHVSGLTKGKFKLHDGKIKTGSYSIRLEGPNFLQVFTYKNQYQVIPSDGGSFANEAEVGAAVYLIDKSNLLSCVGIITRLYNDGVLVTPIQEILYTLGHQLKQTIEIVPVNQHIRKSELLYSGICNR